MGRLHSDLLFPVTGLILAWAAGCGSLKVLQKPTCSSDFLSLSTCEWRLDRLLNCSAALRLSYQLLFNPDPEEESHTCVPENSADAVCVCHMDMQNLVTTDMYQLDLWAGTQLLWSHNFTPSQHVKLRAPVNLTVSTNVSTGWLLSWSSLYPPWNYLHSRLTHQVKVSSESKPEHVKIYNLTYKETTFHLEARDLMSGVSYVARVRALAQLDGSIWSEWSPGTKWNNYYEQPLEQRLKLGVIISCFLIALICLSCYCSITKIKKEWWDQIPNPACSPVVAIVIQDPQVRQPGGPRKVSPWEKRPQGQEPRKCPHWKTCLTKLLPCLLEHSVKKDEDLPKAARNRPFHSPGKSVWCPVEVSRTVLLPETISVVRCVELFEAPAEVKKEEEEEEEEEEDRGHKEDFCTSLEGSEGGFPDGRERIAAQLAESMILGLLGAEEGDICQPNPGGPCLPLPPGCTSAQTPWALLPSPGALGAACWDKEQPLHTGPSPQASAAQGLACTEVPPVFEDSPTYRSFSHFQSQAQSSGELAPDPPQTECLKEGDPTSPGTPKPSEPQTWEQILRQSVLQHGANLAPAVTSCSGYREFVQAVRQGGPQDSTGAPGPSGEAGHKASSSLLTDSTAWAGMAGPGGGSGDGGYKPFHNLTASCTGDPAPVPVPFFTFGLDVEPPLGPQSPLLPGSSPEGLSLEPKVREEYKQKPLLPPQEAADPLRDDLASGIVYSALTCHLCGHLKQCHGQEEAGQAHTVASPCCGCCCGDLSSPPGPPLGPLEPTPAEPLLEANLGPDSLAPMGISEEKTFLSFHLAPSNAQSSSQAPKVVGLVPRGSPSMRESGYGPSCC
ncbi:interleukin-4 receptor subunit alpha isoform X1 [Cavia porcellus]|uniref:interleukin-4 receptor subunit alpha isoform X1 n=1 Tax=Cavia porcellus TaxID=10141 RepID=UPI002FE21C0F